MKSPLVLLKHYYKIVCDTLQVIQMFVCQAYNWRACSGFLADCINRTQVGLDEETNRPILNALKQFLVIWHIIAAC